MSINLLMYFVYCEMLTVNLEVSFWNWKWFCRKRRCLADVEGWWEERKVREKKKKEIRREIKYSFSVEVAFEQRFLWGEEARSKSLRREDQRGWCAWSTLDTWEDGEKWGHRGIARDLVDSNQSNYPNLRGEHSVVDKGFWIISSSKLKKCQVLMAGTSKCHLLKKKCICGCYQGP